jgi:2-polyprenyl-3-methyl-5-hydroxy-6-metoxy-1,4-benzoquinol methylase
MKAEISDRQKVEEIYHDTVQRKGKTVKGHSISGESSYYNFFYDVIGNVNGLKILEVGCGNGWLSIQFARNGAEVHGIDISGELVNEAKQAANRQGFSDRIFFKKMAVENLDFDNDFFDLVIGSAILHHTDIKQTTKGILKVLRPDGRAIFVEPLNENLVLKVWRKLTPWRRSPTERALLKRDLEFISSVFPHSKYYYFGFISIIGLGLLMFFPDSKILKKVSSHLEKLDTFIAVRFESLGPQYAVVVLELKKAEC